MTERDGQNRTRPGGAGRSLAGENGPGGIPGGSGQTGSAAVAGWMMRVNRRFALRLKHRLERL